MNTEERLKLLDAINNRHSVRNYLEKPIEGEILRLLQEKIKFLNQQGNLHMQLITEEPKGFNGIFAYGKFFGVRNYVVVAGRKDETLDDRVGYYGEQLVLYAQILGLNTCWAGLSYKKIPGTYHLEKDEKISCYIAIGYGKTPGVSHKIKTLKEVSNISSETPDWFQNGVEAALLAPTAINQQKFYFEYIKSETPGNKPKVRAKKVFSLIGYTQMDLGIAKYHFEIGADSQNFEWV